MSLADLHSVPGSVVEISARALLALVAGALIGIERQWHHRSAGMRTHALLAVGAAGFGLLAHLLAVQPNSQMYPTQIAAGVVSGIGFLCGGVILQRGGSVQGLTTAASLWTTAGVGLAIGAGFYAIASVLVRGTARAERRIALTAVFLGGADRRQPPGGRAAVGTLSRRPHGRRGREPRRDPDAP
jgi:putative Mg2+ transporter-C (MgtC) family protein